MVEARTTLHSAQAAAINIGVARAQYEHAIAVLLGALATDFSLPAKPQLVAPPPIPVGVPAQLLERRPDVAAAERTLAKDNSVIGIGHAAYIRPSRYRPPEVSKVPRSKSGLPGQAASSRLDRRLPRPSSTADSTARKSTNTSPPTMPIWPGIARPSSKPFSRSRTISPRCASTRRRLCASKTP